MTRFRNTVAPQHKIQAHHYTTNGLDRHEVESIIREAWERQRRDPVEPEWAMAAAAYAQGHYARVRRGRAIIGTPYEEA